MSFNLFHLNFPNRFFDLHMCIDFVEFKRVRGIVFTDLYIDTLDGLEVFFSVLTPIQVVEMVEPALVPGSTAYLLTEAHIVAGCLGPLCVS